MSVVHPGVLTRGDIVLVINEQIYESVTGEILGAQVVKRQQSLVHGDSRWRLIDEYPRAGLAQDLEIPAHVDIGTAGTVNDQVQSAVVIDILNGEIQGGIHVGDARQYRAAAVPVQAGTAAPEDGVGPASWIVWLVALNQQVDEPVTIDVYNFGGDGRNRRSVWLARYPCRVADEMSAAIIKQEVGFVESVGEHIDGAVAIHVGRRAAVVEGDLTFKPRRIAQRAIAVGQEKLRVLPGERRQVDTMSQYHEVWPAIRVVISGKHLARHQDSRLAAHDPRGGLVAKAAIPVVYHYLHRERLVVVGKGPDEISIAIPVDVRIAGVGKRKTCGIRPRGLAVDPDACFPGRIGAARSRTCRGRDIQGWGAVVDQDGNVVVRTVDHRKIRFAVGIEVACRHRRHFHTRRESRAGTEAARSRAHEDHGQVVAGGNQQVQFAIAIHIDDGGVIRAWRWRQVGGSGEPTGTVAKQNGHLVATHAGHRQVGGTARVELAKIDSVSLATHREACRRTEATGTVPQQDDDIGTGLAGDCQVLAAVAIEVGGDEVAGIRAGSILYCRRE